MNTEPATESIRVTESQRERLRRMVEQHGMNATHQAIEMLLTGEEKREKDRARRIAKFLINESMEAAQ